MPIHGGNLLSLQSVADRLDCSTKTVARLVAKGVLPAPITVPGVGKRWLAAKIDAYILAMIEAQAPKPDKGGGK